MLLIIMTFLKVELYNKILICTSSPTVDLHTMGLFYVLDTIAFTPSVSYYYHYGHWQYTVIYLLPFMEQVRPF